jgi:hypothetical protein
MANTAQGNLSIGRKIKEAAQINTNNPWQMENYCVPPAFFTPQKYCKTQKLQS